jgi:hypothetical protein
MGRASASMHAQHATRLHPLPVLDAHVSQKQRDDLSRREAMFAPIRAGPTQRTQHHPAASSSYMYARVEAAPCEAPFAAAPRSLRLKSTLAPSTLRRCAGLPSHLGGRRHRDGGRVLLIAGGDACMRSRTRRALAARRHGLHHSPEDSAHVVARGLRPLRSPPRFRLLHRRFALCSPSSRATAWPLTHGCVQTPALRLRLCAMLRGLLLAVDKTMKDL